jgi:group I intron endonuclease
MVTIYKITSPSGRIYIGQTLNLKRRLQEYKRLKCTAQKLLYASLLKYGFDNHIVEVIEIVSLDQADLKEIHYIKVFNTYKSKQGLNLTEGGKRPSPKYSSEHYKAKTTYQYSLNGKYIKTWKCIIDIQHSLGFNSSRIGMAIRDNISAYGFIWSFVKENKHPYVKNTGGHKSKQIMQYDLKGKLLCTYPSILNASKITGIDRVTIKNSLNNTLKRKSRSLFIWKSAS